jgi:hypothetical protein
MNDQGKVLTAFGLMYNVTNAAEWHRVLCAFWQESHSNSNKGEQLLNKLYMFKDRLSNTLPQD